MGSFDGMLCMLSSENPVPIDPMAMASSNSNAGNASKSRTCAGWGLSSGFNAKRGCERNALPTNQAISAAQFLLTPVEGMGVNWADLAGS
jgi:hypothetical protein